MRKPRRSALRGWALGSGLGARGALAWIVLALAWPGCGAEPRERRQPRDRVTAEDMDSLRFEVMAPREVRAGEAVPITLRLTNTRDRPVEAHFLGRTITFDIAVARTDGAIVWRRLTGATVQGILQIRMLAPGEALELKDVWNQRTDAGEAVGPGDYTVQGILPTDERQPLTTALVRLRITSGP